MSKTILLVEDDPGISACVKLLLNKLPYNLVHVWDGLEAVEYLHNNPRNTVSLILLDINMPRMGGLEFLSAIKDPTLSKIPVILQTAATDEEVQKGLVLGAKFVLLKPYTGNQLRAAIEKVMLRATCQE